MLTKRTYHVMLFLALILLAWWSLFEILQPLAKDQGVFLWAGDVVRSGGVMYRDAWETRGPVPVYFTSVIESLLGHNAWGFRLADLVVQFAGALGIAALIKRLHGTRPAAVAAAIAYIVWYAALSFKDSAQPDGWVGVLLLFAVIALISGERVTHGRMFMCGVLLGLAMLNKPTYGLFIALPIIGSARGVTNGGQRALSIAVAALGAAIPGAIALLYFWDMSALATAVDVHLGYTLSVYSGGQHPVLSRISDPVHSLLETPLALAVPFVIAGVITVWRRDRVVAALLTWWLGAAVLNTIIQGKPWAYEWLPAFAPFAALTGIALSSVFTEFADRAKAHAIADGSIVVAGVALAMAIVVPALNPTMRVAKWTVYQAMRAPNADYQARQYDDWGFHPRSVYAAAQYARARTSPTDYVLFFGDWGPAATYYSDRRSPTRFAMVAPLSTTENPFRARYRKEFMATLAARPPRYVVTDTVSCLPRDTPDEWHCTRGFPVFQQWLTGNYHVESTLGRYQFWRAGVSPADTATVNRPGI